MCGIAGIFNYGGDKAIDYLLLQQMTAVLDHRGPDGQGFYCSSEVGLGHRRLAIVDVPGGVQPLFNEDRSVCVVFNGEIFNFRSLMSELTALGHVFRTRCDTEVIVHAWEEWGEACLNRFNGQFAFGLWDERKKILFLARDRLGEKPLYYAWLRGGCLLFASELKSILCSPAVDRRLDTRAIEEFFALGYVPDPRSIYYHIRKLPPGHSLHVRRGADASEPKAYWQLRFSDDSSISKAEAEEELITRLREAVRIRMIADVPIGALLSGGVDSSAVVAMMARLNPVPVSTFAISFETSGLDESRYAAEMAARYGTEHYVRNVDAHAFDLIDRLATIYDEPFSDSSAMPTLRVSAMARKSVTVVLSGDGGDELFAGYRRYRWHCFEERVRRLMPDALRTRLFGPLGMVYPKLDWGPRPLRAKATFQELAHDSPAAYFSAVSICSEDLRHHVYSGDLLRDLQDYSAVETLRTHMSNSGSNNPLSQVQYTDIKTYLPGDILTKVDRASMANSLEVRVPLLDHTLVEWAACLPPQLKLHGREGKYVLKTALRPFVPASILYRQKQGFVVPLAQWLRGSSRARIRDSLNGPVLRSSGLFDMIAISKLLDQHESGLRDHSAVLWSLLMFESFLRQVHIDRPEHGDAPKYVTSTVHGGSMV
jgi:asparagine synthase (glutamine-hydrolysing)